MWQHCKTTDRLLRGARATISVMGQSTSTNTGISSSHSHIKGNLNDGGVVLPSAGPWRCQMSNATEGTVRVHLHDRPLQLSDLTNKQGANTVFVEKEAFPFRVIAPRGHDTAEVKEKLASVFVQDRSNPRLLSKTIVVNVEVPPGRSFILSRDNQLKLQKQGAENIWMDEEGTDHSPK